MTPTPRIARFSKEVQVARLRRKHRTLQTRIQQERKRPVPCSLTLQTLKRQRLRLKDDIARQLSGLRDLRTGVRSHTETA